MLGQKSNMKTLLPSAVKVQAPSDSDSLSVRKQKAAEHPSVFIKRSEAQTSVTPLCVCENVHLMFGCRDVCVCMCVCVWRASSAPDLFPSQPAGSAFCWVRKAALSHVIEILLSEVGVHVAGLLYRRSPGVVGAHCVFLKGHQTGKCFFIGVFGKSVKTIRKTKELVTDFKEVEINFRVMGCLIA